MGRTPSKHVKEVRTALAARLKSGDFQPGERFLSARAVARRFQISYQTAHRLLGELTDEGLLERRRASGTYVPGARAVLRGVQLIFHPRARRPDSFGWRLQRLLEAALAEQGIEVRRSWPEPHARPKLRRGFFPILWECPEALNVIVARKEYALCLNDRPPFGNAGVRIDAITADDYSGGVSAGEILKSHCPRSTAFAVLAGPSSDPRNAARVSGFLSVHPGAKVVYSSTWYKDAGLERAPELLAGDPEGVFAANDRLAESVIGYCRQIERPAPLLVGFDNAPVAETLRLTTIGIPWQGMVSEAVKLAKTRLAGGVQPARAVTLAHETVLRLTT